MEDDDGPAEGRESSSDGGSESDRSDDVGPPLRASTPKGERDSDGLNSDDSPLLEGEGVRFVFLPQARNVDRGRRAPPIQEPVPDEPAPRMSARWWQSPELLLKYVDDHLQVLKINTETVALVDGVKGKHAVISENTFQRVLHRAQGRGMVVNTSKTNMLCISCLLYTSPSPRD